jgi:hypothetical protein
MTDACCIKKPKCCECYNKFSVHVKNLVEHRYFTWFIVSLIVLNTVVLASEHFD